MFEQDFVRIGETGQKKVRFLQENPAGFFISSMMAGMFLSLGSFVSMTAGGLFEDAGCTVTKFFAALLFSAALSLVVMAGSDLFTGSHLLMTAAWLNKMICLKQGLILWGVCFLGNLFGSLIICIVYEWTGCLNNTAVFQYMANAANAKVNLSIAEMFSRGILCNICVCLAIWCTIRMQSESGKLIMIIWCILIFMLCGFEHSVANMSIIGMIVIHGGESAVTVSGFVRNLFFVSIGNIAGGAIFVGVPYWIMGERIKNN